MLLASVVRLEGMRILDLTYKHVGHPLHRGRMDSVESHKGAALASRITIRFLVVTEGRAKGDLPSTRSLSTHDVIAESHFPAFGPSDISLRRLHQQGKNRGIELTVDIYAQYTENLFPLLRLFKVILPYLIIRKTFYRKWDILEN